ncbi:hypothetical protein [Rhizorhabdus sp.]|uniref:hypothetical protein n=1 Tax=Rhizorhabdus sp. TaxID=1968843 RepID=UPI0035B003E2
MFKKILRWLIEPPNRSLQSEIESLVSQIDFTNPQARISWKISQVFGDQLTLLNLESSKVPVSGHYASAKFRGAILGTAVGLARVEGVESDREMLIDTIIYSFIYVYGERHGRNMSAATVEDFQTGDAEVIASDWALEDFVQITTTNSVASVSGVYLAGAGLL